MMPRYFCWAAKCFCDTLMRSPITRAENGMTSRAIRVMVTFMVSITTTMPTMLIIAQMKLDMLWESDWPRVSTSFVIRDKISPVWTRSK